jgi:hypothetical protein
VNAATVGFMPFPPLDPADLASLSDAERARLERIELYNRELLGYAMIQSTRRQTLARGLTDSPVGQLAWIVEKFKKWTDPAAELPEDAVNRDHMLTDVSVYRLTATGGSSAQSYYDGYHSGMWGPPERSKTPPASWCSRATRRSAASPSAPTISCTGRSSTQAATSQPCKPRTCW